MLKITPFSVFCTELQSAVGANKGYFRPSDVVSNSSTKYTSRKFSSFNH